VLLNGTRVFDCNSMKDIFELLAVKAGASADLTPFLARNNDTRDEANFVKTRSGKFKLKWVQYKDIPHPIGSRPPQSR
jgi:hypothetical protein